jgi:glucose-1-phosphate cytidylyltransferase
MKVVILCGGVGSRLSEETKKIPKPMVRIGNLPILIHIMNLYASYGFTDFILALGYKKNIIKKYFKGFKQKNWKIDLVDTGTNSLTGTRVLKLKEKLIKDNNFLLTYGDGLSNVNIKKTLKFHNKFKKIATVTAVRPPARFGELVIKNNNVINFYEKNQIREGWINGGFFIFNKKIFNFIPKRNSMLERETIKRLTINRELAAYKHSGFWQCMDTLRDKELLNKIWKSGKAKW